MYRCLCNCGEEVKCRSTNLRNGNTKSCGCYKMDMLIGKRPQTKRPIACLDCGSIVRCTNNRQNRCRDCSKAHNKRESATRRRRNLVRMKELQTLWRESHRGSHNSKAARYRARKKQQLCTCCTAIDFKRIYDFAHMAGMHVDHMVPLIQGGRHCQRNLQLLTPEQNLKKHDKSYDQWVRSVND